MAVTDYPVIPANAGIQLPFLSVRRKEEAGSRIKSGMTRWEGEDSPRDLLAPDAFCRARRETLSLGLELLIAALMVPVLALFHGMGLMGMSHVFNLTDEALLHKTLSARSIFLVAFVAMLLFALHAFEIGLIAAIFLVGHGVGQVEQALVVSASYYTTTGAGSDTLPDGWRLIGHAESLLGLLMIGWSTAYLVRKIDRLQEREGGRPDDERRRRLRMGGGYGGHEDVAEETKV